MYLVVEHRRYSSECGRQAVRRGLVGWESGSKKGAREVRNTKGYDKQSLEPYSAAFGALCSISFISVCGNYDIICR